MYDVYMLKIEIRNNFKLHHKNTREEIVRILNSVELKTLEKSWLEHLKFRIK